MFDIGFTELLLVAVVALVVLGPERLPKAARFAGLWVRRARAQWYSVKSELERELAADELKRSLHDARTAASDLHRTMQETEAEVQAKVRAAEAEARREIESLRREVTGAPDAPSSPPAILTTDAADYVSPAQGSDAAQAVETTSPAPEGTPAGAVADAAQPVPGAATPAHHGNSNDADGDDGRQR